MSSVSTHGTQSDNSQLLADNCEKLNALQRDRDNVKRKYNAAAAHNEELKLSLDSLKADFKKITEAYDSFVELNTKHLIELERLRYECDVLKRKNNLCVKHDPEKDMLIANLRAELKGVNARNAELDAARVTWVRSQNKSTTKRGRSTY